VVTQNRFDHAWAILADLTAIRLGTQGESEVMIRGLSKSGARMGFARFRRFWPSGVFSGSARDRKSRVHAPISSDRPHHWENDASTSNIGPDTAIEIDASNVLIPRSLDAAAP